MNELQQDELAELKEFESKKEAFKVTDESSADWVLRKLTALNAEEEANNKLAQQNIDRIEEWRDHKNQSTQQSREYFENLLTAYFNEQRYLDPKFKIDTPNGKVTARKIQPKWNYNDEALVQSLKAADANELIRIKEEPDKKALKKTAHITESGEVITDDGIKLAGVHVDPISYKTVIKLN
ncbi:MAG: host-nuclease inhibitor Gam family protein [Bacillota bacterium]|nr:host-nuclease inhibitor Gam family protein [Bacillota bacterium]